MKRPQWYLNQELNRKAEMSAARLLTLIRANAPDVIILNEIKILNRVLIAATGKLFWEIVLDSLLDSARAGLGLCTYCDTQSCREYEELGLTPLCREHYLEAKADVESLMADIEDGKLDLGENGGG